MGKKTKYPYEGELLDAEELEFEPVSSARAELNLEDGTVLKLNLVPLKVVKLAGRYNEAGEPIYFVRWNSSLSTSVPPELVKLPKEAAK